jgi:hypothetical protein
MSGGYFHYRQNHIQEIVEDLEGLLEGGGNWSEPTVRRFREAMVYLTVARVYAQRIDWLVSGDDGEETFHSRLEDELDMLDLQFLIGTKP